MHELPLIEKMLDIILEEAKAEQAAKITKIELTIGKLSGILPACVQFGFDVLSRKTIAAGAKLEIHQPGGQVRCRKCSEIYTSQGVDDLNCPNCKEKQFQVLSGREFTVDSIEYD